MNQLLTASECLLEIELIVNALLCRCELCFHPLFLVLEIDVSDSPLLILVFKLRHLLREIRKLNPERRPSYRFQSVKDLQAELAALQSPSGATSDAVTEPAQQNNGAQSGEPKEATRE